jgi:SNW domain-containing protein 1
LFNLIQHTFVQDFGDGGAFPEIPVAQYPLNMGREGKESTSNALAVQLDAQGKIKYDILARQGHSKDKVIHLILKHVLWFKFSLDHFKDFFMNKTM